MSEAMSLQLLTEVAQLATAVAVVPSLFFVGIQLRQATQAVKASSSQAHAAMYQALNAGIVDNVDGFAKIWRTGLRGTEALTEEERARFFAFTSSQLRFFESARVQWLRRQLDQEHWRAVTRQAKELACEPGVQEFWSARRHWHCVHFQRWFDSLLDDGSAPAWRVDHERNHQTPAEANSGCFRDQDGDARQLPLFPQSAPPTRPLPGNAPSAALDP